LALWRVLLSVRRIVGGGWFTRDDPSSEISSRLFVDIIAYIVVVT